MDCKYLLALLSGCLFFSCEMKKDLFGEGNKIPVKPDIENQGLLDLELKPEREAEIPGSKGGNVTGSDVVVLDVNAFTIDILDGNGGIVKHYDTYADLKEEGGLLLPAGNYTVRAALGEEVNAGFDMPFYSGTNVCEITPNEVARVITECVLSNKKVTFRCSDEFLAKFEDDYTIVVDNNIGALTVRHEETRTAYLKNTGVLQFTVYASLREGGRGLVYNYDLSKNGQVQGHNNILVELDPVVEPDEPEQPPVIDPDEPVDPGDPEEPELPGTVALPVIRVDVSLIEKEYVIEIPSDFVDAGDPDDNPGGSETPGGDAGKPAKPTIAGVAGLNISEPIDLSGAGNKTVRLTINTPGKLASLKVKITSPVLEALLPAVELPSEFDILDASLKEPLGKLGLTAQKGATSTIFDISSFMPMIAGLKGGGEEYIFTVTATDEIGQSTTRKLTIRNMND